MPLVYHFCSFFYIFPICTTLEIRSEKVFKNTDLAWFQTLYLQRAQTSAQLLDLHGFLSHKDRLLKFKFRAVSLICRLNIRLSCLIYFVSGWFNLVLKKNSFTSQILKLLLNIIKLVLKRKERLY